MALGVLKFDPKVRTLLCRCESQRCPHHPPATFRKSEAISAARNAYEDRVSLRRSEKTCSANIAAGSGMGFGRTPTNEFKMPGLRRMKPRPDLTCEKWGTACNAYAMHILMPTLSCAFGGFFEEDGETGTPCNRSQGRTSVVVFIRTR